MSWMLLAKVDKDSVAIPGKKIGSNSGMEWNGSTAAIPEMKYSTPFHSIPE
jgi:hypothetical protein